MKKLEPKEAEIQKAILNWLRVKGYVHWRNYVGPIVRGHKKSFSPNPMAGLPDIMGVLKTRPGVLFAAEIKTKSGRVSPNQRIWVETIQKSGAHAFITRGIDQFIEQMQLAESGDQALFALQISESLN